MRAVFEVHQFVFVLMRTQDAGRRTRVDGRALCVGDGSSCGRKVARVIRLQRVGQSRSHQAWVGHNPPSSERTNLPLERRHYSASGHCSCAATKGWMGRTRPVASLQSSPQIHAKRVSLWPPRRGQSKFRPKSQTIEIVYRRHMERLQVRLLTAMHGCDSSNGCGRLGFKFVLSGTG